MFSTAIMMHPLRVKYRDYLLSEFEDAVVVMDRGRGLWDTARRAWLSYDPKKKFHTVIQDDVILSRNFKKELNKLLKKYKDKYVICSFMRRKAIYENRINYDKGIKEGKIIWWKLAWAQCVTVPTKYILEMIAFCDGMPDSKYRDRDDVRMKHFFKKKNVKVYYPIPSLVQHREDEDSLIDFGHNKGRQAIKFIDDEN